MTLDEIDAATDAAAEVFAQAEAALQDHQLEPAAALADDALARFVDAVGMDHPDVANTYILRSRIARERSQYAAALENAQAAVALLTAARVEYPDEDIVFQLYVRAVAQLAAVMHSLGRYDDAEQLLLPALAEVEGRADGERDVATLSNLLGISHKYQARWDDAARRYRRAIDILVARHGEDSLELASLYHNLGGLDHGRGEPALAEPHARRAVEIREAALGPDHPTVAADLAAWAAVLDDLGRVEEAEAAYRRALDIFVRVHGEVHYEVGFTLASLGALQAGQGRWNDAAATLYRAFHIQRVVLEAGHPDLALVHQYLAVVEHGRGDLNAAATHAEAACAAFEARFPADHFRVADARLTRDRIAESLAR